MNLTNYVESFTVYTYYIEHCHTQPPFSPKDNMGNEHINLKPVQNPLNLILNKFCKSELKTLRNISFL